MGNAADVVAIICTLPVMACSVGLWYLLLCHIDASDLMWGVWIAYMVSVSISAIATAAANKA